MRNDNRYIGADGYIPLKRQKVRYKMQLVIEISDERYKEIVESDKPVMIYRSDVAKALANGTPLPKGHGRIGDLDALREEVSSWGMNDYEPLDFIDVIDEADAIIEADKE